MTRAADVTPVVLSEAVVQTLLVRRYFWDPRARAAGFCPNLRYACLERDGFDAEADLLVVAASGLASEFEIKLSRDDFFRDFSLKSAKHAAFEAAWQTRQTPHRLPNRLLYAAPMALRLDAAQLPPYAGLIAIRPDGGLVQIKSAPLIHRARQDGFKNLTTPLSWRLSKCLPDVVRADP